MRNETTGEIIARMLSEAVDRDIMAGFEGVVLSDEDAEFISQQNLRSEEMFRAFGGVTKTGRIVEGTCRVIADPPELEPGKGEGEDDPK